MASIRCHTVPQFYLDYFLPEKSSSFWVYNKKDFKSRQQQPINTTVIGDYYLSLPDATGEKDKRMEDFFSKIEGNAKLTFDKIIQKDRKSVV